MRYSGLMQAERRPASLSSVPNKRLRKQIVFEIGETIHSGPTLVVKEEPKDEDIEPNCVFPGDTRETPNILPDGDRPADIPSKRCSPRLLLSPCAAGSPVLGGPVKSPECKVAAAAKIAADIDSSHTLTQEVKAEPCVAEACSSKNKSNVLEVATEALVPEDKVTLAAVPEVPNVTPVPKVSEAYIPEATDTKAAVPGDTKSEALVPESVDTEALVPEDTVAKAFEPEASEAAIPKEKVTKVSDPEPHAESSVIEKSDITESATIKDIVSEASVQLATVPEAAVIEAAIPGVIDAEAVVPETAVTEATVTNITDIDGALPGTDVKQATVPEEKGEELKFKYPENPGDTTQVAAVPEVSAPAHPHASLPNITEENREMVRLIQEADGKIDSFCHKRSSRASKRLGSTDFDAVEVKPDPISRNKRSTRTRRTSCRSDRSESEVSDSRSVADESLCCDMVDKTTKRGKPKIGEPLQEEAATHVSAKYNGDVSSDLVNGTHKVKGRRISRTNSDESDCSSTSRSNGNIDHNGEKVDFSLLLEISAADRKKFESKKAKIRRKTADWTLISETEQYYNEKEEIMRNKNKPDSDSESDESDNCAENNDSKSECSDVSENTANHTRSRGKGRGKQTRTMDEDEEESKSVGKRIKDDTGQKIKSRRTVGSRTRKTRYDLTLLNDDDDDDEETNKKGERRGNKLPPPPPPPPSKRESKPSHSRKNSQEQPKDQKRVEDNSKSNHKMPTKEKAKPVDDKVERMRELAKLLSKKIGQKTSIKEEKKDKIKIIESNQGIVTGSENASESQNCSKIESDRDSQVITIEATTIKQEPEALNEEVETKEEVESVTGEKEDSNIKEDPHGDNIKREIDSKDIRKRHSDDGISSESREGSLESSCNSDYFAKKRKDRKRESHSDSTDTDRKHDSKDHERHRKKHKKEKKDKHKSRDKSKKKGKKFEGERIDFLVKKRVYQKTEEEEQAERESAKSQDQYVLEKLFKKSGVHTALSHDAIMSNGDPDYLLVESEAERVAKEALKAVRASRARCFRPQLPVGPSEQQSKSKPRFGTKKSSIFSSSTDSEAKPPKEEKKKEKKPHVFDGGMDEEDEEDEAYAKTETTGMPISILPSKKGKGFGPGKNSSLSSSQLLQRMRQRNRGMAMESDGEDSDGYDPDYPSTAPMEEEVTDPEVKENIDLLTDIRNFVAFQARVDGKASTQEILDRFQERLPAEQTPFFKALLTEICDFQREAGGEGLWILKGEFR
ncbi:protein IWS1 homolog A-like isoform X2 [Penaeus monodon]|uniref:protein IWS1 homolog A-like isoform X2 n=1 Tax=Penaeus monodon TaxID=6687 RepID=UPI0018A6F528|nr:protein IWS1 homolog A-like isoform X2 [Penaeus monodon]